MKGDFTGLNITQFTSETEDKMQEKTMNYISSNITDCDVGRRDSEKKQTLTFCAEVTPGEGAAGLQFPSAASRGRWRRPVLIRGTEVEISLGSVSQE